MKHWGYEAVFYQIYPLGLCGAPFENDGVQEHRILKVLDWVDHIAEVGCNAVYFSPIFESDTHGYNTRDYCKIDCRLGTNEDFKEVCDALHKKGIRVVLDGVFNHVGRGFPQFRDVCEKKGDSPYKDWFNIDFNGNSAYNDGLWYEGWEGHYDLVKLNLKNPAVVDYLLQSVKFWVDTFDIDGIRLDVAYCLDFDFLKRLRRFTDELKEDFFLVGELLHGDYSRWVNPEMLHSATNYECYKGLFSSFNSMNLFEICHSLKNRLGRKTGVCIVVSICCASPITMMFPVLPAFLPIRHICRWCIPCCSVCRVFPVCITAVNGVSKPKKSKEILPCVRLLMNRKPMN